MPSRGGVLVASGVVWTVVIALVAILTFVVRRRWARAAEDLRRLLEIAAEETARAEADAEAEAEAAWRWEHWSAAAVSPAKVGGEGVKLCAVCHSHTKTRCSRCKSVWYCSGRCQIIHWRQGHKDDCRPPEDILQYKPSGDSDLNAVHVESKLSEDGSDIFSIDSAETYIGRNSSFDSLCSSNAFTESQKGDSVIVEEDSHSDHSISHSSSSTPVHEENLDAASSTIKSDSSIPVGGRLSLHYNGSCKLRESNNVAAVNNLFPPPITVKTFTSQVPHSNKLTGKSELESGLTSKSIDHGECCAARSPVIPDSQDVSDIVRSHITHGNQILVKARNGDNLKDMHPLPSLGRCLEPVSSCSLSVARTISHKQEDGLVTHSYQHSKDNYLSQFGTSEPPTSADTVNSHSYVAKNPSSEVFASESASAPSSKFLGKVGSTMRGNSTSSFKTSIWKPTQQLRQSKPRKMLFPYELFVKLYNEKVELCPCGFSNLGNSCYANVVLQSLIFTRPLTAYLLHGLHKKTCQKKEWCFTCEFESLAMEVKQGRSPLSPTGILSQLHNIGSHLSHGREEDAHEFLRYAIDAMQSVCLKECGADGLGKFAAETSLIQLVFGGYLRSKIKCLKCRFKSERYERMMDLTVEIQGDIGNLDDALHQFTSTELLDGDNKYHCGRCKSYERAKKKLTVAEAPNILTIVLKRFQSGKFGKINKVVKFPEILNLAPYVSNPNDKSPVYSLYAVVVHVDIMNAAFSGHYVCYVKNPQGQWFKADDSSVKPVDLDKVMSKGAYMLLYARCLPRAPSLIWDIMPSASVKMKSQSFNRIAGQGGANSLARSISSHVTRDEFDPLDPRRGRSFRASQNLIDSSSDSSSLLSFSDEGSCSTESTRDSMSIDDHSGKFSPSRFSEDSDCLDCCSSPDKHPCEYSLDGHLSGLRRCTSSSSNSCHLRQGESSKRTTVNYASGMSGESSPSILHSDPTKHCRKLTEQCSRRETDWVNPCETNLSSLTRRLTRDKTAQAFL